jgi:hypothetical protein
MTGQEGEGFALGSVSEYNKANPKVLATDKIEPRPEVSGNQTH